MTLGYVVLLVAALGIALGLAAPSVQKLPRWAFLWFFTWSVAMLFLEIARERGALFNSDLKKLCVVSLVAAALHSLVRYRAAKEIEPAAEPNRSAVFS